MRKLFLSILLIIPLFISAQENSLITEVVESPNKDSGQIYKLAKEWFVVTFNSAKDVIQLDDPAEFKLIGKGVSRVDHTVGKVLTYFDVYYTLTIQSKDGRFKYDLQPTLIKDAGDHDFTLSSFKELGTEEGLKNYYAKMGVKSWMVSKAKFQESIDINTLAASNIETKLRQIANDLKSAINSPTKKDNW